MSFESLGEDGLIGVMRDLNDKVLDRLRALNVCIPEFEKCGNILRNKNSAGYRNLQTNLYSGCRRLDEMGVDDDLINRLSSDLYSMSKNLR